MSSEAKYVGLADSPDPVKEAGQEGGKLSAWDKAKQYKWYDPRLVFTLFTHPSHHLTSQSARRRARAFAVTCIGFFIISVWSNILAYQDDDSSHSVRILHSAINALIVGCYALSRTAHYQTGADLLTWSVWVLCLVVSVVDLQQYADEYHLVTSFMHWLFVPCWMFLLVVFSTPMRAASVIAADTLSLFFLPLMSGTTYGTIPRLLLMHAMCDVSVLLSCLVHQRDLMQLAETEPDQGHGDYESTWMAFKHVLASPVKGKSTVDAAPLVDATPAASASPADIEVAATASAAAAAGASSPDPSLPSAHLAKPKSRLAIFFSCINVLLFHPSSHITDRSKRRRARVLSGFTLFLMFSAGAWIAVFNKLAVPQTQIMILSVWIGVCALLYLLSRTRAAPIAAWATIIGVYMVPYIAVWANADTLQALVPLYLTHSTLTALLATMLLGGWQILLCALLFTIPTFAEGVAPFPPTSVIALLLCCSAALTWLDLRDLHRDHKQQSYAIAGKRDLLREKSLAWTLFGTVVMLLSVLSIIAMTSSFTLAYMSATLVPPVPLGDPLPQSVSWILTVQPDASISQSQQFVIKSSTGVLEFNHNKPLADKQSVFYLQSSNEFTGPVTEIDVSLVGGRGSALGSFSKVNVMNADGSQMFVWPAFDSSSVPFQGASASSGLIPFSTSHSTAKRHKSGKKADASALHWQPISFTPGRPTLDDAGYADLWKKYQLWYDEQHHNENKTWTEADFDQWKANLVNILSHNEDPTQSFVQSGTQWMHLDEQSFLQQRTGLKTPAGADEESTDTSTEDGGVDNSASADSDSYEYDPGSGDGDDTSNSIVEPAPHVLSTTTEEEPQHFDTLAAETTESESSGVVHPLKGSGGGGRGGPPAHDPWFPPPPSWFGIDGDGVDNRVIVAAGHNNQKSSSSKTHHGSSSKHSGSSNHHSSKHHHSSSSDTKTSKTSKTSSSSTHHKTSKTSTSTHSPVEPSVRQPLLHRRPRDHDEGAASFSSRPRDHDERAQRPNDHDEGPDADHGTRPQDHDEHGATPLRPRDHDERSARPHDHDERARDHDEHEHERPRDHDEREGPQPVSVSLSPTKAGKRVAMGGMGMAMGGMAMGGMSMGGAQPPIVSPGSSSNDKIVSPTAGKGKNKTPPPPKGHTPVTPTTPPTTPPTSSPTTVTANQGVDWAASGYVTPVRDQGACGCCWAFSSSALVESTLMVANKAPFSSQPWLSVQDMIDCATPAHGYDDAAGCDGGLIEDGLNYAKAVGLALDAKETYKGVQDSTCKKITSTRSKVSTFWMGINTNDATIMKNLATGPVAAAIAVDMNSWASYGGGVISTCATQVNHGILIVGYGTDPSSGLDYYKIKNSWGPNWGEDGYVRLMRNGKGHCGITKQAYRPTI